MNLKNSLKYLIDTEFTTTFPRRAIVRGRYILDEEFAKGNSGATYKEVPVYGDVTTETPPPVLPDNTFALDIIKTKFEAPWTTDPIWLPVEYLNWQSVDGIVKDNGVNNGELKIQNSIIKNNIALQADINDTSINDVLVESTVLKFTTSQFDVLGVNYVGFDASLNTYSSVTIDNLRLALKALIKSLDDIQKLNKENMDSFKLLFDSKYKVFDFIVNKVIKTEQSTTNTSVYSVYNIAPENITVSLLKQLKTIFDVWYNYTHFPTSTTTSQIIGTRRILINTPSNIFRENDIVAEFTDKTYDIAIPNIQSFTYNVKTNPSPDGKALVKVPKINSFVFLKHLKNGKSFVDLASEYDEVDINIDNDLSLEIKEFLINARADYLILETGAEDNQGLFIRRDTLTTNLIEFISLQQVENNQSIELREKDILLDGKNGKIGIGKVGEGELSTPFDNDLERLTSEQIALNDVLDKFVNVMIITELKHSVIADGVISIPQTTVSLNTFRTKITQYVLSGIERYDDFRELTDKVFDKALDLKREVSNQTWANRATRINGELGETIFNTPDSTKFNSIRDGIETLTNDIISDRIAGFTPGSVAPVTSKRFSTPTDFKKSDDRKKLYRDFLDSELLKVSYPNYYTKLNSLIQISYYHNKFEKEREYTGQGTRIHPAEGASIIALYLMVEWILINASIKNMLALQQDYIKDQGDLSYSDSLGLQLSDLVLNLKGVLIGYMTANGLPLAPNNPPILQNNPSEATFDNSMVDLDERIKKLHIL